MSKLFLIVFLFGQGVPDIPLEISEQPDLATCLANARKAMDDGRDVAASLVLDEHPLVHFEVSAVCREMEDD